MKHVHVPYVPDPTTSPARLREAIDDSGKTRQQAAEAIGITDKHLKGILDGKDAFPPQPEFVARVAQVLPAKDSHAPLDPKSFPGYRAWAEAHPSAALVVERLAQRLYTRDASTGKRRARKDFFEQLRANEARGSDTHWNAILRGAEPFPRDPKKLEVLAEALNAWDGRADGPEIFAEYPVYPGDHAPGDLDVLCRLAQDLAVAIAEPDGGKGDRRALRAVSRVLLDHYTPSKEVEVILTALRAGRDVRALAHQAEVDLNRLLRLLLGLDRVNETNRAIVESVRKALGKPQQRAPFNFDMAKVRAWRQQRASKRRPT